MALSDQDTVQVGKQCATVEFVDWLQKHGEQEEVDEEAALPPCLCGWILHLVGG